MRNYLIIALLCAAVALGFNSSSPGLGNGVSGPSRVVVSPTPPANPLNGLLWWDPKTVQLYIWYNDGTSSQWVPVIGQPTGGGGTNVVISTTKPASPHVGMLWWDPITVQLYIFYNDGTSSQWVPVIAQPGGGNGGHAVAISSTAPTSPAIGQLWFDTVSVQTFLFYNDGTSSQWVPLNHVGGGGGTATVHIGTTPPSPAVTGNLWYDNATGQLFIFNGSQWVALNINGGTWNH